VLENVSGRPAERRAPNLSPTFANETNPKRLTFYNRVSFATQQMERLMKTLFNRWLLLFVLLLGLSALACNLPFGGEEEPTPRPSQEEDEDEDRKKLQPRKRRP
jgi:hypothetical protein